MALTIKFLKGLEIPEDKAELIVEEHAATINGLKTLRDKYKAKADQYDEAQKT